MTPKTKPIPPGLHSVTPTLTMREAGKAIDFYKRAFGAEERMRFLAPDGKGIMHAEIKIGDSIIFLSDERPEMGCRGPQSLGGTPVGFFLYVEDVDQAFDRAVSAGAKSESPVSDMFWGDRCGPIRKISQWKKSGSARRVSLSRWPGRSKTVCKKSHHSCGSMTKPKRLSICMCRFLKILRLGALPTMEKKGQRFPEDRRER